MEGTFAGVLHESGAGMSLVLETYDSSGEP